VVAQSTEPLAGFRYPPFPELLKTEENPGAACDFAQAANRENPRRKFGKF
jgi:hypothetical protein